MINGVDVPVEYSATVVKYWQFYCATLAGLEIHERKCAKLATLHAEVAIAYDRHAANLLKNEKEKFDARVTLVTLKASKFSKTSEELTGEVIWRKFNEAKLVINNKLSPIWASLTKNGIPSGKQVVDIIREVRMSYYETKAKETIAKKKGSQIFTSLAEETQFDNANQVKPISENDFPLEWIAFVRLGPPALGNCHDMFKISLSNGPPEDNFDMVSPCSSSSATEQSSSSQQDGGYTVSGSNNRSTTSSITTASGGGNSKRSSLSRNEQRKRMKNSVDDEEKKPVVGGGDAAKKLERINNIGKAMESNNQILERQINAEFNRQKLEATNQKQKIWTEKLQGLKFMIELADDVSEKKQLIIEYKLLLMSPPITDDITVVVNNDNNDKKSQNNDDNDDDDNNNSQNNNNNNNNNE